VADFFNEGIEVTFPNLCESDWEYDKFRESCRLSFNIPDGGEELVKVGELNIENKLFDSHSRFISVNNKSMELQMMLNIVISP
jgi:hypothetical protein